MTSPRLPRNDLDEMSWEERFWYAFQSILELERDLEESHNEVMMLRAQDYFRAVRDEEAARANATRVDDDPMAVLREMRVDVSDHGPQ